MKEKSFVLENNRDIDTYFSDEKIKWLLKNEYNVIVKRNDNGNLEIIGDDNNLVHAMRIVANIAGKIKNNEDVSIKKFNCLISLEKDNALELEHYLDKIIVGKTEGKNKKLQPITPMTLSQFELVVHLLSEKIETILATGEAGSGKTYLTVCVASLLTGLVEFSANDQKDLENSIMAAILKAEELGCLPQSLKMYVKRKDFRIHDQLDSMVIFRPIVATQDIGFLPGTADEKVEPYLKQVFAYLNEIPESYRSKKFNNLIVAAAKNTLKDGKESMSTDLVNIAKASGLIKVELVELARGSNFKNSFIIGDELENVSTPILEMLLDRPEDGCKIAFSGDIRQCDLKSGIISGLAIFTDMYKGAKEDEVWRTVVVDLPDVIRSIRTKANHRLLERYLEEHSEVKELMKKGQYAQKVQATPNKGK